MQKLIDFSTTKLDEIKFCGTILEAYARLIALIFQAKYFHRFILIYIQRCFRPLIDSRGVRLNFP